MMRVPLFGALAVLLGAPYAALLGPIAAWADAGRYGFHPYESGTHFDELLSHCHGVLPAQPRGGTNFASMTAPVASFLPLIATPIGPIEPMEGLSVPKHSSSIGPRGRMQQST